MIEIVIFAVFFGSFVIAALVADARGVLSTAIQLREEDRQRSQRWQASR